MASKGRSRSSNLRSKGDKVTESAGKKKRDMITMEQEKGLSSAAGSRSHKVDKGPANAPKKRYSSSNGTKGATSGPVGSSASVKREKRKMQGE